MKTTYTKNKLSEVPLKVKPRVIMPKQVLHKIQYLCQQISKVEWSGIILYAVEGSIKNPSKMKIHLKDILPMNKGTKAYTEYNFVEPKRDHSGVDDKHMDYVMENEEAMEWKIGHIHSHNSMGVFFSGTDMDELHDNAPSHDFYFSIIVNNFMDFTAKVAFIGHAKAETSKIPFMALDEDGNEYQIDESVFLVDSERLYILDCDIKSPINKPTVDPFFVSEVQGIIQKAEDKEKEEAKKRAKVNHYPGNKSHFPPKNNKHHNKGKGNKFPPKSHHQNSKKGKVIKPDFPEHDVEDEDYQMFMWNQSFKPLNQLSDIEGFTIALLRGSTPADENINSVELALEEISAVSQNSNTIGNEILSSIAEIYNPVFEQHFPEDYEDLDFVLETTEEVIEILENEEIAHPFLAASIMFLKGIVTTLENSVIMGV